MTLEELNRLLAAQRAMAGTTNPAAGMQGWASAQGTIQPLGPLPQATNPAAGMRGWLPGPGWRSAQATNPADVGYQMGSQGPLASAVSPGSPYPQATTTGSFSGFAPLPYTGSGAWIMPHAVKGGPEAAEWQRISDLFFPGQNIQPGQEFQEAVRAAGGYPYMAETVLQRAMMHPQSSIQTMQMGLLANWLGAQPTLAEIKGIGQDIFRQGAEGAPGALARIDELSRQAQQMAQGGGYVPQDIYGTAVGRGLRQGQIGPLERINLGQYMPGQMQFGGNVGMTFDPWKVGGEAYANRVPAVIQPEVKQAIGGNVGLTESAARPDRMSLYDLPDFMERTVQGGLLGRAANLLAEPQGLTPEVQAKIMRDVRDQASRARESGIEQAMTNLGARGLGTRGALGSQAIIGAHQREGEEVARAQRQLATQAAMERPQAFAQALGAAAPVLGQAQQYGLAQTAQSIQEQQNLRQMLAELGRQRLQEQATQQDFTKALMNYGLGYAGLGGEAERRAMEYALGRGGLGGAVEQRRLQQAELGLQQQIAQAEQQQKWNQLLSSMGYGQEQLGLEAQQNAQRQNLAALALSGQLGGKYYGSLMNQLGVGQALMDYGMGQPFTQLGMAGNIGMMLQQLAEEAHQLHRQRVAGGQITPGNIFGGGGMIGSLGSLGNLFGGGYDFLAGLFSGGGAAAGADTLATLPLLLA